jgi:hypothetical protein
VLIEQAIFTSAESDHAVGYHLVARSPGIDERDSRELTIWGPSHDSLESPSAATANSVNFFRLSSGAFCVSKTQIAGEEYSGRGLRTYTHYLVVPPQVLSRFANNPFAILRAAWAKGFLRVCDTVPAQMIPFQLAGRAAPVDEGLIGQLVEQFGADAVGRAIEALFGDKPVVLIGAGKTDAAVAGLLSLFPASCRRELPFTTGLKYSPRRPFQLLAAPEDSAELRRLHRQQLVNVIDIAASAKASPAPVVSGWGGYIAEAITRDAISAVVERLRERQEGLHLADLNELGDHWRQELPAYAATVRSRTEVRKPAVSGANELANHADEVHSQSDDERSESGDQGGAPHTEEHPARAARLRGRSRTQAPSALLAADSQEVLDHLERLDDVVFDAMSGDERALEEMTRLWPRLLSKLGPDKLDESREQYLRHSLSVWENCLEDGLREPERALSSLQVLSILFGEK